MGHAGQGATVESNQQIRRSERTVFRELTGDEPGVLLHLDSVRITVSIRSAP